MDDDTKIEYVPMIRDLATNERPRERLINVGPRVVSSAELLAIILRVGRGGESAVRLAERLLVEFDGLPGLMRATVGELTTINGIGPAKAAQIKAALELGRRVLATAPEERPKVTAPEDAANLLMSEMAFLEQEHLKVILLNTRNEVLRTPTVYIGSLNTSVVRIGELFRAAIRENAAAVIVVHNHPSGAPRSVLV